MSEIATLTLVADFAVKFAVLVLAAGISKEGPGPLVSSLAGAGAGAFPIPITIVPGHLKDEDLDALA